MLSSITSLLIYLDRTQRLKDAKEDAMHDIEALKQSKLDELTQYENLYAGSMETLMKAEEERTLKDIEATKEAFARNKQLVIELLLKEVVQVEPKLHENYHQ